MLAKIDTATEVTKSVNVLTAIRWVALAWHEVKPTTIQKCFRHAGILTTDLDIQVLDEIDDPFESIDEGLEMSSLISQAMGSLDQCSTEEYVNGDDSLPVCIDLDDDQWDEVFLSSLTREENSPEVTLESEGEEEEDLDVPPTLSTITTCTEATHSLEDIKLFLEQNGLFNLSSSASSLIDQVSQYYSSTLTQSTLDKYMSNPD